MDELTRLRVEEAEKAWRRGWVLLPLKGKVPLLHGWTRAPKPSLEQVREWAARGNVGVRTGPISGIFVVDEDTRKGGRLEDLGEVPRTPTVETGGGGRHLYFRAPDPCPGNSASRLLPHVDTRGVGGQVVFVGSVHPVSNAPYLWAPGLSPDEVPLAELPESWLERLASRRRKPQEPPGGDKVVPFDRAAKYARAAVERETEAVSRAIKGTRNDTLNRAAFNLGQLVAGGVLDRAHVEAALFRAAEACGLVADDGENSVRATIRSGLQAGARDPRTAPEPERRRTTVVVSGPEAPRALPSVEVDDLPEVIVPGSHLTDQGEYFEVGNDRFAAAVLDTLPEGLLYRRSGIVGELVGPPGRREFREATVNRIRVLVDRHMRLMTWRTKKSDGNTTAFKAYQPCTRDQAGVVLDHAAVHPRVRDLRLLINYPVFLGEEFRLAEPGWNAEHGVFYDEPEDLQGLEAEADLGEACALLHDLVVDFPWKTADDMETFFGLLLTPLLRPALNGNVPMFLILSPLERTGKSKLAEQVVGGVILGHPTPAMQLSGTDEERDKRILALLLDGATIVHIDNVREYLDSASLASLLTSRTYSGRLLGRSQMLKIPNNLTLIATGNNVRATGEIVKRTVPLRLQPRTDSPETRTDFKHPDLPGFVRSVRRRVLGSLVALVQNWIEQGRPARDEVMGGFEEWSRVVGGIMQAIGYTGFLAHMREWQRAADPHGEELRAFVAAWAELYQDRYVTTAELLHLAEEHNLFGWALKASSERARLTAFSMRVLGRHVDAPVGRWIIRTHRQGNNRLFYLEPQEAES